MEKIDRTFCVAPMVGWTDRHFLYLLRLLSKKCMLYTEMVMASGVFYRGRSLQKIDGSLLPVGLQLAGSDPKILAYCGRQGEDMGYSEINLNVGCPSPKVMACGAGVAMMLEPERLADCFHEIQKKVTVPVTIKCRIGVGNNADYASLHDFASRLIASGCRCFIIHARKAIPSFKSTRKNRTVPSLSYPDVFRLKRDFPEIEVILNGGIKTVERGQELLPFVDGVMSGRSVCSHPPMLADVDHLFYGAPKKAVVVSKVFKMYIDYLLGASFTEKESTRQLLKPLLLLLKGRRGAKDLRRTCAEEMPGTTDADDFKSFLSCALLRAEEIMEAS